MPTDAEIRETQPLVSELMGSKIKELKEGKIDAVQFGDAARAFAHSADTEAGKYILLRGSVISYSKSSSPDKSIEALNELEKSVKNIPLAEIETLLLEAAKNAGAKTASLLHARLEAVRFKTRALAIAEKLEKQIGSDPDNQRLRRCYAEAIAASGNWKQALTEFAELSDPIAAHAKAESDGGAKLAALGDAWWEYKPLQKDFEEVFRKRAVRHYRKALSAGELSGLKKQVVEKRIAPYAAGVVSPAQTAVAVDGAVYCVIDLSCGPSAGSYPVTYLNAEPKGGFNTDEYKTRKLVLKRVPAGSFTTSGGGKITLSKGFYAGIFTVTQKQWELVTGSNPCSSSAYGKGSSLPVHYVSFNDIRGGKSGSKWPASASVDSNSFLGVLRARSGLEVDLPTEAQWEYVCRAGTDTTYNYGDDVNDQCMWYAANSNKKHHPVGEKTANPWGFYDMHGGVWEWCLDWYNGTPSSGVDPKGFAAGSERVKRGGSFLARAESCASSFRRHDPPSGDGYFGSGFRVFLNQ